MKRYLLPLLGLLISTCFSMAALRSEQDISSIPDTIKISHYDFSHVLLTDSVVNYGKLFLNTPYHYGSPGDSSFDCSGFTSFVYRNFGYSLGRSSSDQAKQFDTIDRNKLKVGDLVFFSGRQKSKRVGHVGIVVSAKENGEFDFIHAAVHSGVIISNSNEDYYAKRFVKAGRVIGENQMLAINKFISKSEKQTYDTVKPTLAQTSIQKIRKKIPAEYHRVKSGETLSSIARKFGLSISELKHLNRIKGSRLALKQNLKVKEEQSILVDEPVQIAYVNPTVQAKTSKSEKVNANKNESPIIQQASVASIISSHIVKKGETLFGISKLYNTSVDELKKINNIISGKIHPGQELKLNQTIAKVEPERHSQSTPLKTDNAPLANTHKVISGETLIGISKMYNVPILELKKINNLTSSNIHAGQNIKLTESAQLTNKVVEKETIAEKSKVITHKVQKGESLITISKKFDIPVVEIKKINNLSDNKIRTGQKLKLNKESDLPLSTTTSTKEDAVKSVIHKVKSGESYYSIAKVYGCSIDELRDWNHKTGSKVKVGEKVIVFAKAGK